MSLKKNKRSLSFRMWFLIFNFHDIIFSPIIHDFSMTRFVHMVFHDYENPTDIIWKEVTTLDPPARPLSRPNHPGAVDEDE